MTEELMIRGVDLMLYGMGTVIVFLSLLVGLTSLMSRLITTYFPMTEAPGRQEAAASDTPVSALVLRILQAAVDRRRTLAGQYSDRPRR